MDGLSVKYAGACGILGAAVTAAAIRAEVRGDAEFSAWLREKEHEANARIAATYPCEADPDNCWAHHAGSVDCAEFDPRGCGV